MAKQNNTKVVTGIVRLSYANVWEPKSINGGDPKYSCSIIIPKSDKGHTVVVLSNGAKAQEEIMPASFKLGDRLLKNGCVGADVKQLQEALIRLGIDRI